MRDYGIRILSVLALIAGFVFVQMAPASAKECKETTSQTTCERSTTCSWVNGYTISKGKQKGKKVSSYCRKKGGKKKAGAAAASKKKTSKAKKCKESQNQKLR